VVAERPRVFLASRNTGKLAEMQRILAEHVPGVEVLGLDDVPSYDEPAETESTFEGNARIKALAGLAATGLPSLADDSGLAVDALNGMPGVLSARWAGASGGRVERDRANNDLLLAQLSDVPDERRGAAFHCCVALAVPSASGEPVVHAVDGVMRGRVIREVRGSGGFGYDVLFCADGHDVTTAELPPGEKDAISHRGKALREIAPVVAAVLGA
jgi:XTP/dITP diphosphohydrolase